MAAPAGLELETARRSETPTVISVPDDAGEYWHGVVLDTRNDGGIAVALSALGSFSAARAWTSGFIKCYGEDGGICLKAPSIACLSRRERN